MKFVVTYSDAVHAVNTMGTLKRKLFGGAIEASIPDRFVDVSDFRPVPDHQEIFSDEGAEQSVIIEIVEYSTTADESAARFYLNDLADVNGALERSDWEDAPAPRPAMEYPVFCAQGTMLVEKGRGNRHWVRILLGVIRLPDKDTDILVSLNTPTSTAEHYDLFLSILASFDIVDWSLFG